MLSRDNLFFVYIKLHWRKYLRETIVVICFYYLLIVILWDAKEKNKTTFIGHFSHTGTALLLFGLLFGGFLFTPKTIFRLEEKYTNLFSGVQRRPRTKIRNLEGFPCKMRLKKYYLRWLSNDKGQTLILYKYLNTMNP